MLITTMKKILVTGSNGQLGSELKQIAINFPQYEFLFTDRNILPIDQQAAVDLFFEEHKPDFCINCAAYTAVDKAETDRETAMNINGNAPGFLGAASTKFDVKMIHVSTDYVFNGNSSIPYNEEDQTDPVNFYGQTKLEGELNLLASNPDAIVIRTAWVYSEFGNNFVKTMLRLMKDRPAISVVNDQVGSPTYARDLAELIMVVVQDENWKKGIYHYSNEGEISWYDFALQIREVAGLQCEVNPVPSSGYPTPAKRPAFSLLDKSKIKSAYNVEVPGWKESLSVCMKNLGV
ncbi:MAG: dTDP-4-dehydrorhamnose reductase [Flavitalea sp.]